jgi:HAD superfamily hydrolase (TIGR01490 family)
MTPTGNDRVGAGALAEPGGAKQLTDEHIFLTGGTGFVGQAILERLLSSYPGTRISVLIRGKGSTTGQQRLKNMLRKPVFAGWIESVGGKDAAEAEFARRVVPVGGSLSRIDDALPDDLDVVIHSASTVSFDPPIDEAFETNVGGANTVYDAVHASGADPHVVHISTAYVGGMRKGISVERSLEHTVDWRTEHTAAISARDRVELESRLPEALRAQLDAARAEHGKTGPQAVAGFAEAARIAWVRERLVDFGRTRAESLGWTDVYTLTKAFAERVAEERWGSEHRLTILRPSIIESALRHPFPGWIDGFKVADPLILAYGRGQLPDFPGLPDSVLDVIPVDFVVNATIAAAANPPAVAAPQYFQVVSGASNPLPFHAMYENVHDYFTENPLPSEDGDVVVPTWRFPGGNRVERELERKEQELAKADAHVGRMRGSKRSRRLVDRIQRAGADLEVLRGFTELYRAYVQSELVFDDTNTRALDRALPESIRGDLGFDVTDIDWRVYFQQVHFPAITTMTRAFANRVSAKAPTERALPERTDVLAVFDLEGTVVDSNLVEQYLLLWPGGIPRSRMVADLPDLFARLPGYLRTERQDRGDFIREFMRRYRGFTVADLERLVEGSYGRAMRRRVYPAALERVAAHRAAGHRTVLVTGSIELMVEPLREHFDEIVAGTMHVKDGVLTGYLDGPPLVDESRAAWLRRYAEQGGFDLGGSYGYGDSHADLIWLQETGNPNVVNPDVPLYRHARSKRWRVNEWARRD